MAKTTKALNYKDLTITTFKEKSSLFYIGLITFSAVLFSLLSLITFITKNQPTSKNTAKEETKGETAPKFPTSYTVVEGDTLATISQKVYGADVHVTELMQANNLVDETLEVGQKLIVPKVQPTTIQGQIGEGIMTDEVTHQGETYTVQPGDTLSIIALKVYGDINAWIKIVEANNILNPEVVEEGTVLIIPKN